MTVYFIRRMGDEGGLIKIGFTDDLRTRVSNLTTAAPEGFQVLCTVPGGRDLEAYFHTAFVADRVAGEWFKMSRDLDVMISLLNKVGVGALPAGAAGVHESRRRGDASNSMDVMLASRLIRRVVEPVPGGVSIGGQIALAARRLEWPHARAKSIWYGEAHMIAAWEMRQLHGAANERWVETHAAAEIEALRRRVSEIETRQIPASA